VTDTIRCDICIIGAGSAGLSVAAAASQLGAATVLVERGKMGGDCLNTGCVPSKALLAAAKAAAGVRRAASFGIAAGEPVVDFAAVMRHVHETIAAIAPMDSEQRFAGLGTRVIRATARFTGPREIVAGETTIRARRFVVATGSRPAIPAIPGLDAAPYLTNETLLDNTRLPDHLVIIGAGSVGIEMAQAHARLGSRVTILDSGAALAQDDPELAELLCQRLRAEGVTIREAVAIARVERDGAGVAVVLAGEERLTASHLLVATGRIADLDGLDLARAGVEHGKNGIRVDAGLRTTNRKIYAIGDVAGGPQFTHVAGYHAGIVVRSALFRLPAKVDYRALPWVTFTDPELAHSGLTEAAARARFGDDIAIVRASFHENDRAQAERTPHGLVKVVTRRNGNILGAAILGAAAGELIQPWVMAIGEGMKIKSLAGMIAPYPTLGEASKRAAVSYFVPKLLTDRTRRLVAFLARFG
jgi:pyruvate/2-oxoglutarate dehydrogenase complex dihydrolipoamide dehydrogenase (E3) component